MEMLTSIALCGIINKNFLENSRKFYTSIMIQERIFRENHVGIFPKSNVKIKKKNKNNKK